MKRYTMLFALLALASTFALSQNGGTDFKAKCAACHGAAGEGKIGPALKGTKLSEADITKFITAGAAGKKAPHTKGLSGLSEAQAKGIAAYVKSLK